jgi:hypothetical protein
VCPNSARIKILNEVPTIPDQAPKIKYKVPISLWFVETAVYDSIGPAIAAHDRQ